MQSLVLKLCVSSKWILHTFIFWDDADAVLLNKDQQVSWSVESRVLIWSDLISAAAFHLESCVKSLCSHFCVTSPRVPRTTGRCHGKMWRGCHENRSMGCQWRREGHVIENSSLWERDHTHTHTHPGCVLSQHEEVAAAETDLGAFPTNPAGGAVMAVLMSWSWSWSWSLEIHLKSFRVSPLALN